MEKKKHYLVYQITNTVNGKIYIGKHETYDIDDDYMGSGKLLKRAQQKYGIDKFTKEILADFSDADSMNSMEALLVNEEFVAREDTYNINVGGEGGFYYVNQTNTPDKIHKSRVKMAKTLAAQAGCSVHEYYSTWAKQRWESMSEDEKDAFIKFHTEAVKKFYQTHPGTFLGKHHTKESLQKQHDTFSKIGHQQGCKNSQYGTQWWMDQNTGESRKFHPGDIIPEGWIRGRKIIK